MKMCEDCYFKAMENDDNFGFAAMTEEQLAGALVEDGPEGDGE